MDTGSALRLTYLVVIVAAVIYACVVVVITIFTMTRFHQQSFLVCTRTFFSVLSHTFTDAVLNLVKR